MKCLHAKTAGTRSFWMVFRMKKAISYSFIFFVSFAAFFCGFGASRADVAARSYVDSVRDSLNTAKPDKKIPSEIGNLAALDKDGSLADSGIQGGVVATKSYVDTAIAGISFASERVIGKSVTSANAGDTFEIVTNGFIFRAVKQSNAAYWGLRIINATNIPAQLITKSQKFYNSLEQTAGKNVVLATGDELNPDDKTGNLGQGGDTIFVVRMFDSTRMNYYIVNFSVFGQKALLTVELVY
jgi:hypothetical protein